MEHFFVDMSSVQLFKVLVWIFLKLATFVVIIRLLGAIIPPRSFANCILARFLGLPLSVLFAWWYGKSFLSIFQPETESTQIIFFVFGLGINILVIRVMFPMPSIPANKKGGEDKDGKNEGQRI